MKTILLVFLAILVLQGQQVNSLPEEYQTELQNISKDDFGKNLLQDIIVRYQQSLTSDQMNEIELFLNSLEQMNAQQEQEEMDQLQCNKEQWTSDIEELKAQAAQLQYEVSSIGGTLQNLQDMAGRIDARMQEKQDIIDQYNDVMSQLTEIRNKEKEEFEKNRDDSFGICNLIKRCRYLIKELLPRNPVLAQQTSRDSFSQEDLFSQIGDLQQEALEQLGPEQPIYNIITEFTQMTTDSEAMLDNRRVDAMLKILQDLFDQVDQTSRVQYNAEDDRVKLYQSIKDQVDLDIASANLTISELNTLLQQITDQIKQENGDKTDQQQRLENIRNQIQDLQKMKDDSQSLFEERSQLRKVQLRVIREIRNILHDYFESAECYIEDVILTYPHNS